MVGRSCSLEASGAGFGVTTGAGGGYTAMDGYVETSTMGDTDDGGSHDGRCLPSGTCAPPFWKYGTIGTTQLVSCSTSQNEKGRRWAMGAAVAGADKSAQEGSQAPNVRRACCVNDWTRTRADDRRHLGL
jgi:hypothetical protein